MSESIPPHEVRPAVLSVAATDHSIAIGRVDSVENMHVNVENARLILQSPAGQFTSAATEAARGAVATADAVLLGPLASTDAQHLLNQANAAAADDPEGALALYRDVQRRLIDAGFPGHAAEFDQTVAALCVAAGDEKSAIRLLLDALWSAENSGNSVRVDRVAGMLKNLAGYPELGSTNSPARSPALGAAFHIADFVTDHVHTMVPGTIEMPFDAIDLVDKVDHARTVLFAAERALGNDDLTWIRDHREQIEAVAVDVYASHPDVGLRLRLAVADAVGEWEDLIEKARTGMGRDLKALTLARHARYLLTHASPAEADSKWQEAIGEACVAERNTDAADWLYSQRFIASRYRGVLDDRWNPLAQAISDLPSQPKIVTNATDVRERALGALHYEKPRSAVLNLRRQLLDGIRSASFVDEQEARRLLAGIYRVSGEATLALAAHYALGAGDYEEGRRVALDFGDVYHDVTETMRSSMCWVAASAFQFAAEQADLVPDNDVDTVVDLAISTINDVMSGHRLDSPVLSPKLYLSGYELLAALAERLSAHDARRALDLLADAVTVEKHHYRSTDRSHVVIAAGVARAHAGELGLVAVNQLIGLYERDAHPFRTSAREVLMSNLDQTRDRLQQMASRGHHEAGAILAYCEPENVATEAAQAAAGRLCTPTRNGRGGFGTGTGAVNDSLVAGNLPPEQRVACIEMLLSNAASPWEPSSNRNDYLIAASNLADDLNEESRSQFFAVAMRFSANPPASRADAFNASMSSPLGGVRIDDQSDCRPAAAFLAARISHSTEERRMVRDAALRLIGVGGDDDFRVAESLKLVRSELGDSVGLLARGSWRLRSLAAIMWAESVAMTDDLGEELSRDRDGRVRRALARALVEVRHRDTSGVRDALLLDPRWSIRTILKPGA